MLSPVQFRILEETAARPLTYTGRELRPHWGLERTGIYGSLLTAFIGPCEVKTDALVDMEDRLASDFIRAESMLHVIGEFFGTSLEAGVLYQRLLMSWAERLLREAGLHIERRGDDLMVDGDRKLSVSIATATPVSVLIHWGINIDSTGAPVKAAGLGEHGWRNAEVLSFAKKLLSHYIAELEEIRLAQCKVRPVGGDPGKN
jgi:hypothetical protein